MDEAQIPKIHALAETYGLSMLVVFGSLARKDMRQSSDADIAYLADAALPLMDESKLSNELSTLLKRVVDLVNVKMASPLLARNIFKNGQLLYEKEVGIFDDYFARSIRIYEETMPLYKLKMALL